MDQHDCHRTRFHESTSLLSLEEETASGPNYHPMIKRFESQPNFWQSSSLESDPGFDRSISNSESSAVTGSIGDFNVSDGISQFRAPCRISLNKYNGDINTARRGMFEAIRTVDAEELSSAEEIGANVPTSSSSGDPRTVNGSEISVDEDQPRENDDFSEDQPLGEVSNIVDSSQIEALAIEALAGAPQRLPNLRPTGVSLPLTLLTEFLAQREISAENTVEAPVEDATRRLPDTQQNDAEPSAPPPTPETQPTTEELLEYSRNHRNGLAAMKIDEKLMQKIDHSLKFQDDVYEYRYVVLPRTHPFFNLDPSASPRNRLLSEKEWRSLGIRQTRGWDHYSYSEFESNVLLFRRPLETDPQTGFSSEASRGRVEERLAFIDETRKKLRST